MQTYLEVKLPVSTNARWFNNLKERLDGVPVRWQDGYYHITIAFIDEAPSDHDVSSIIDKYINSLMIHELTFDKLDVFTAGNAGTHIVNLTISDVPDLFKSWVTALRNELSENGCVMESDFRLHVTLGRVDPSIDLKSVQEEVAKVSIPSFSLPLHVFEYRYFRGNTIKLWNV